jgi:hypothetical protein
MAYRCGCNNALAILVGVSEGVGRACVGRSGALNQAAVRRAAGPGQPSHRRSWNICFKIVKPPRHRMGALTDFAIGPRPRECSAYAATDRALECLHRVPRGSNSNHQAIGRTWQPVVSRTSRYHRRYRLFAISGGYGGCQPVKVFDGLIKISAQKITAPVRIETPKLSELTECQPRFQSQFEPFISARVYPAHIVRFPATDSLHSTLNRRTKPTGRPSGQPSSAGNARPAVPSPRAGMPPGLALGQSPTRPVAIITRIEQTQVRATTHGGHIARPAPTNTLPRPRKTSRSTATFLAATAHPQQHKNRPRGRRK